MKVILKEWNNFQKKLLSEEMPVAAEYNFEPEELVVEPMGTTAAEPTELEQQEQMSLPSDIRHGEEVPDMSAEEDEFPEGALVSKRKDSFKDGWDSVYNREDGG
jgi:hypothetical protein